MGGFLSSPAPVSNQQPSFLRRDSIDFSLIFVEMNISRGQISLMVSSVSESFQTAPFPSGVILPPATDDRTGMGHTT